MASYNLITTILLSLAISLSAQSQEVVDYTIKDSIVLSQLQKSILNAEKYIEEHNHQQAYDLLEVQINEKYDFFEETDTILSRLYLIMARSKINLDEYVEADSLITRAITKSKKVPQDINQIYPICMSYKGQIEYYTSNLDSSEYYYREAIKYYKLVHGNYCTEIASTYSDLCMVLLAKGKFKKSLKNINKAINHYVTHITEEKNDKLSLFYKNKGTTFQYLNQVDSAIFYHTKCLNIRKKLHNEKHYSVATAYNSLGSAYGQIGNVREELSCYEKAKPYYESQMGKSDNGKFQFYGNLAIAYKKTGDLNKSDLIYQMNISEILRKKESKQYRLSIEYHNYASLLIAMGDYQKAKTYVDSAIYYIPKEIDEEFLQLPDYYNTYGVILGNLGNDILAVEYYEKSIRERKKISGTDNISLSIHHHNMATRYFGLKRYNRAIQYSNKAIDYHLASFPEKHINMPYFYDNIGACNIKLKNFDLAIEYFNKSKKILDYLKISDSRTESGYWFNLAQCEYERENHRKSLQYINLAIDKLKEGTSSNSLYLGNLFHWKGLILQNQKSYYDAEKFLIKALQHHQFEENIDPSLLQSIDWVISDLQALASNYNLLYKVKCDDEYEHKFRITNKQLMSLSSYKKSFSQLKISTNNLNKIRQNYEINLDFNLHKKSFCRHDSSIYSKMFHTIERSKYQELSQITKYNNALNFSNVPSNLVEKDILYRKKIFNLEHQKQKIKNPVDSFFLAISEKLSVERKKYNKFKTNLEEKFPQYYSLIHDQPDLQIRTVQNSFRHSKQALVEYLVSDSSVYTFTILPDTFFINQVKIDFPINEWVEEMIHGIYAPFTKQSNSLAYSNYSAAAFNIYTKVFAHVDEVLPKNTEIIIIPDGILGYIPFDALLTHQGDQTSYLIKDHQISYAYSATLLAEMQNTKHTKPVKSKVLAFAPSFDQKSLTDDTLLLASRFIDVSNNRNWLGPLKYNDDEILGISKIANTDLFLDSLATKENFLKAASEYSVIHLSTHGKANDKIGDYSFLAFYDKQDSTESWLYNRELYGLDLNAEMVVLSACETGIGELQRGEGIISLARGFSYAGAKSIITTLWSVNDQSTQKIMELFYANLAAGMHKDAALREAKLVYIQEYPNLGSSPYFWAGIIPIGDMSPIDLHTSWYEQLWIWLSIATLSLAGLFSLKKKSVFFSKS